MPALYSIQPTFAGGEIAPGLQGRVDLAKYATGLNKCLNAIIHPQGGASNRSGFNYIAKPKYADKKCRLISFEFSATQAYIIELGDQYARFFAQGGAIESDPALVSNYDPTVTTYVPGSLVKMGCYREFFVGEGMSPKYLGVNAPYGDPSTSTTIEILLNSSDDMTVTYSAPKITIKLANATRSKNRADLIQTALRASNVLFVAWCVTASVGYAIAPPITLADPYDQYCANAQVSPGNYVYACTSAPWTADGHNENGFPEASYTFNASYWDRQTVYEVPMPYLEADLPEIKFTQSADTLYLVHPDYAPRTLVRYAAADWRLALFPFVRGPFMPSNATTLTLAASTINVGNTPTITASASLFTSDHVGALFEIDHDLPSQTVSGSFSGNAQSSTIMGMGGWRLITHGTWAGKITVEKSLDGGSNWIEVRVFTSTSDFNPNTFGTDDNDGSAAIYRVTMTSYASGTCNYDLTIDACTVRGIVRITAYTNPTSVTALVIQQLAKTTATTDWSEGSWSTERGWPSAVSFFQDRICFGRTPYEPQTIWISKTGEYVNFGTSDPLVDDDSISISLPSRKLNGIETLVPLGELLVLTRSSEWSVGSGSGEPVTPTTVTTKSHGFRGTNGVDAIVIGNRSVYVQPQGTVMRDIGFDFSSASYTGDDISLISSHLFASHEIIDLCYQQEPDSLIWAIREDGVMLSATYLREQQVLAWSQHNTDGLFEAVATIPGDGYDELWVVTKRGSDRFIERQAQRMVSELPEDQFFVDCGITYDDVPVDTITGLDHLEGRTVAILADGVDLPEQVVASGQITLEVDASVVHVGLAYVTDIETLRLEVNQQDGTIQGRKSRCSHVNARFLLTRGGKMGPDEDNLYEIDDLKKLETLEAPLALVSGDVKHTIAADWDNGGRVFYRQDRPLPVTILAFMPVLTVGG